MSPVVWARTCHPTASSRTQLDRLLAPLAPSLNRTGAIPAPAVDHDVGRDGDAAGEYETLSLGSERPSGSERVGGVVAGKFIISDAGRRASIIVSDKIHDAQDGVGNSMRSTLSLTSSAISSTTPCESQLSGQAQRYGSNHLPT